MRRIDNQATARPSIHASKNIPANILMHLLSTQSKCTVIIRNAIFRWLANLLSNLEAF
jgi:hypothetical protein